MRFILLLTTSLLCLFSINSNAEDTMQWLTINSDLLPIAVDQNAKVFSQSEVADPYSGVSIIQMDNNQLHRFSELANQNRGRCGGFMVHDSFASALAAAQGQVQNRQFQSPTIDQSERVNELLPQLDNGHIADMIRQQAEHYNRYYKTTSGAEASAELRDTWSELTKNLPYASVKQISHSFEQKSVELTIKGSDKPDEIIVIGAHLDSISGTFFHKNSKAPGADDDASGIASITEIIRVMAENHIQPQRTIRFYGYAAEEGGLLGSKDVVHSVQQANENVLSAVQLDMTNYKGSAEDFVFMMDYTDANLTHFLEKLTKTYLSSLTYAEDKCGYACSDHANWTRINVPSAMPFESYMSDHDPYIHSKNDTLANSDPTATTALNFSKLGLTYVIESAFL